MDTEEGQTDTQTKNVLLFLTNAESGQSNTILALALEASTRQQAEVHVASFPILQRRVEKLSSKIKFHPLDGKGTFEIFEARGISERDLSHPPVTKSFVAYDRLQLVWDGESHMQIYYSTKNVIEELKPTLVVIDSLMGAAFEACFALNQKFVINSPNTLLDVTRLDQPWLKGFWYYPLMSTGISFPISWKDLPMNIAAALVFIWKTVRSPGIAALDRCRNSHGLPGRLFSQSPITRAAHVICPSVRETDFPMVIPDYLGLYGPIVLDATPVEVSDPHLNSWLNRGKTVLMSMGTHFHYSDSQVKAILDGFLSAVTHDSNTQFLWKLPDKPRFENLIREVLRDPKDEERFKIVDWLDADPASVMKHPNLVAWIHHGGANSYFEGTLAGLPQIILAQWYDLYDMAVRAEYLGIGIYGNKNVAPEIEAVEFGAAVARLVRPGRESEGFRTRAKDVAEACRKAGGKRAAVDKLMEIINDEYLVRGNNPRSQGALPTHKDAATT